MSISRPGAILVFGRPRIVRKFSRNEYAARLRRRRGLPARLKGFSVAAEAAKEVSGTVAIPRLAAAENLRKLRRVTGFMAEKLPVHEQPERDFALLIPWL